MGERGEGGGGGGGGGERERERERDNVDHKTSFETLEAHPTGLGQDVKFKDANG